MKLNAGIARLAAMAGCMISPAISNGAIVSWLGGGGVWVDGDAGNGLWDPADEPDADDTARFNAPFEIAMGSDNTIARLELASRAELNTAGWDLTIAGDVKLLPGGGVALDIAAGSTISAAAWQIEPSASLTLQGGELQLREQTGAGQGEIEGDAYLSGHGVVAVTGVTATRIAIVNDGIILADRVQGPDWGVRPEGTLRLTGSSPALIDLDGQSETGIVSVQDN